MKSTSTILQFRHVLDDKWTDCTEMEADTYRSTGVHDVRRLYIDEITHDKIQDNCNWTEDFGLENGKYMSICISCGSTFIGEKYRVICKMCHVKQLSRKNTVTHMKRPTAANLLEIREKKDCSLQFARHHWWRHQIKEELMRPDCDLKDIILIILDEFVN